MIAGVCAGLARHLGWSVGVVRIATVVSTAFLGFGLISYLVLWALMPNEGAVKPAVEDRPTGDRRMARRLTPTGDDGRARYLVLVGAALAGVVGVVLISDVDSLFLAWGIAGVLALIGAALAWGQMRVRDADLPRPAVFTVGIGWAVAATAFVTLLARNRPLADVGWALFATAVLLVVTAVILFPIAARLWRDMSGEHAERVREAERADIAAHLHDSVLQTLALIRSRSHDPAAVTALARSQERELREWLYSGTDAPAGSLASEVANIAQAVELDWQVPIDVVTVGDATEPAALARPLVAATREAITNAARHGRTDVRVFAEFTPEVWEVFVRDRGPGFDPAAVPDDRRGVRDSIEGRMRRHGGEATIRSGETGTEVHLRLPVPMSRDNNFEREDESRRR